jgi:hypothetical protein
MADHPVPGGAPPGFPRPPMPPPPPGGMPRPPAMMTPGGAPGGPRYFPGQPMPPAPAPPKPMTEEEQQKLLEEKASRFLPASLRSTAASWSIALLAAHGSYRGPAGPKQRAEEGGSPQRRGRSAVALPQRGSSDDHPVLTAPAPDTSARSTYNLLQEKPCLLPSTQGHGYSLSSTQGQRALGLNPCRCAPFTRSCHRRRSGCR